MQDSELDALLRASICPPSVPPKFQSAVWKRLETAAFTAPQFSFTHLIARPWAVASSMAAMIALGLWLGALSTPQAAASSASTANRYVRSISPFAHPTP